MGSHRTSRRSWIAGALLLILLIGDACKTPRSGPIGGRSAGDGPAGSGSPAASAPEALAEEIEAQVAPVEPAAHAELRELAVELAADWQREAGGDEDAVEIVALLRRELSEKLAVARGDADARLEIVRAEVYDRRARTLSRRSFALGKAVIDGAIADATARRDGEQLLREVAAVMPLVRALRDPERVRVLSGELQEVSLEATFAIARGATSRRLDDYRTSKSSTHPR